MTVIVEPFSFARHRVGKDQGILNGVPLGKINTRPVEQQSVTRLAPKFTVYMPSCVINSRTSPAALNRPGHRSSLDRPWNEVLRVRWHSWNGLFTQTPVLLEANC